MNWLPSLLVVSALVLPGIGERTLLAVELVPAFPGAEGFGATSRGGTGGPTLRVVSLEDDPQNPRPGTLRWAIQQKGPRIIRFDCAGNIRLKAALSISEPFLTIDGSDAPGDGICLCDHSLALKKTHDIVVRHIRIRRGDIETLRMIKAEGLERPRSSADLDCVSMDDSAEIIFDHVSASWSNDEIFGIVRCRNVTIQWCLLAEPLSNPAIHPYGDNHAFGMNLSASTLSVHHCLIAHYVMRGPQFEANDVRRSLGYNPQFESVNNVLFDYQSSGSRYTAGIEDHPEEAIETSFAFQFINNLYISDGRAPEIQATLKHGVIDRLKVYLSGNIGPHRDTLNKDEWSLLFAEKTPMRQADQNVQSQLSKTRLFTAPVSITTQTAQQVYELVLKDAGCSIRRDSVDERIIDNVRQRRTGRIIRSQNDVGGWPELK